MTFCPVGSIFMGSHAPSKPGVLADFKHSCSLGDFKSTLESGGNWMSLLNSAIDGEEILLMKEILKDECEDLGFSRVRVWGAIGERATPEAIGALFDTGVSIDDASMFEAVSGAIREGNIGALKEILSRRQMAPDYLHSAICSAAANGRILALEKLLNHGDIEEETRREAFENIHLSYARGILERLPVLLLQKCVLGKRDMTDDERAFEVAGARIRGDFDLERRLFGRYQLQEELVRAAQAELEEIRNRHYPEDFDFAPHCVVL